MLIIKKRTVEFEWKQGIGVTHSSGCCKYTMKELYLL